MKPRNFYLFVSALALWMAWATAVPAHALAALGSASYGWAGGEIAWMPTVDVVELDVVDRARHATGRAVIDDLVLRTRIEDRVGETLGGFHWHGPIPAIVTVRTADGAFVRYRLEKGSTFAEYLHGRSRDVAGDVLFEKRKNPSARDAG